MTIEKWRVQVKGGLRGFVDVGLGRSMIVHDCPVMTQNGRSWVSMPGRPRVDAAGVAARGDNGKILYAPAATWRTREAADQFSRSVLAELLDQYPDALGEGQ